MSKKRIVVLSLGWLGLPLYQKLKSKYELWGSYYSMKREVENNFQYDINKDEGQKEILNADIIILNIPPSKIESLVKFKKFLENYPNQRIVFISSTSVYGLQGMVNEASDLIPETENGKFLVQCENLLKDRSSVIIRPGGLYGEDRHPAKFLSGKERQLGAKEVINMIDRESLISIIEEAISHPENQVINAVNCHHPLKREFYQSYCKKLNIPPPIFKINRKDTRFKQVDTLSSMYKVSKKLE